jgi:hypothetical protein
MTLQVRADGGGGAGGVGPTIADRAHGGDDGGAPGEVVDSAAQCEGEAGEGEEGGAALSVPNKSAPIPSVVGAEGGAGGASGADLGGAAGCRPSALACFTAKRRLPSPGWATRAPRAGRRWQRASAAPSGRRT